MSENYTFTKPNKYINFPESNDDKYVEDEDKSQRT